MTEFRAPAVELARFRLRVVVAVVFVLVCLGLLAARFHFLQVQRHDYFLTRAELIPLLRQATVFRTTAEWVGLLEAAGVPCGPINDLAQVFADPQVQARGLRVELPNSLGSVTPQVASPLRLSQTPVDYRLAPPLLGEHSEAILQRLLGLDAGQIAALRTAGVV